MLNENQDCGNMGPVRLRIILIGGINAVIGSLLLLTVGFSDLIMGYILASLAIFVIGMLLK